MNMPIHFHMNYFYVIIILLFAKNIRLFAFIKSDVPGVQLKRYIYNMCHWDTCLYKK